MRPFAADDADRFHGRDAEITELISRLRAGERETFVIGPSGSGKSSLVTAGVLPRLARGGQRRHPRHPTPRDTDGADRVAQTAVKMVLEPLVEPIFQ
jgi:ABC-type lipoprotein export system ATPase subunit